MRKQFFPVCLLFCYMLCDYFYENLKKLDIKCSSYVSELSVAFRKLFMHSKAPMQSTTLNGSIFLLKILTHLEILFCT